MRNVLAIVLTAMLLLGCRQKAVPVGSTSTNGIGAPFEGNYYIVGSPECTVVLSNGFYSGAAPYNLTGSLDGSGHYMSEQIGSNTWELPMADRPWSFVVRAEGGSVWLSGKGFTNEVELRRR